MRVPQEGEVVVFPTNFWWSLEPTSSPIFLDSFCENVEHIRLISLGETRENSCVEYSNWDFVCLIL